MDLDEAFAEELPPNLSTPTQCEKEQPVFEHENQDERLVSPQLSTVDEEIDFSGPDFLLQGPQLEVSKPWFF